MVTYTKEYLTIADLTHDILIVDRKVRVIDSFLEYIRLPEKVSFTRIKLLGETKILVYREVDLHNSDIRKLVDASKIKKAHKIQDILWNTQ